MDSFHIFATYAIIVATVVGYATERFSLSLVSVCSLAAILLLFTVVPYENADGVLGADALLAGFSNPALLTVLALLIVGQGLFTTDAMTRPAQLIAQAGGRTAAGALLVTLLAAAVLSAFLNNTPVVVIFIPVLTVLAAQRKFSVASALMPLSFLSILGGMTTIIGSSTNLLVAGVAERYGEEVGFFDITIPGLVLAFVGGLFIVLVMPRLISASAPGNQAPKPSSGAQYIGEIQIGRDHPFVGIESRAGMFPALRNLMPRVIERRGFRYLPPFEDVVLSEGDRVVVNGTRRAYTMALAGGTKRSQISAGAETEDDAAGGRIALGPNYSTVEAIVAPGSRHAGRTLRNAGIETLHGVDVLGVQRRSRMGRQSLAEIRLEPGDVVLLGTSEERMAALRHNHDLVLLEWSAEQVPQTSRARIALFIFGAIVAVAASGLVPIVAASIIGAVAMMITGCLTLQQAQRAFDGQIFILVGASIALATALEQTGGAELIANTAMNAVSDLPNAVILSVFFLLVSALTNILSNNATAVLATPIGLSVSAASGIPVDAMIAAVIFAANCSFATPIGYQTNLLVMGPGGYSFADFLRAGVPLAIVIWISFSLFAPWYYSL